MNGDDFIPLESSTGPLQSKINELHSILRDKKKSIEEEYRSASNKLLNRRSPPRLRQRSRSPSKSRQRSRSPHKSRQRSRSPQYKTHSRSHHSSARSVAPPNRATDLPVREMYENIIAIGSAQGMISQIDKKIAAARQEQAQAYKQADDKIAALEIERAALSVSIKAAATKIALCLPIN